MNEQSRKNLQDAFVGDPDPLSEGANADASPDAPEAVEFKIIDGVLRAQVPKGTPTEEVLGPDRFYEADLVLEDGTNVAIMIAQGADGVDVLINKRSAPGLSSVEASLPAEAPVAAPAGDRRRTLRED